MDNLTHSLTGWALGQTGLKRKGLAALILGANMPDIDVFLGWVPWTPLATHRGWTHSLVGGFLLMPPFLAGLLWLLDRWQVKRGEAFASGLPMRFGWLVVLSYLGTLTHPLLDWQTTYAIQLFSPFDLSWYHTDALFIADVWIWAGLATAIWLSRRRERAGRPWQAPAIVGFAGLVTYVAANAAISAVAWQAPANTVPGARPQVVFASPPPALFWRRDVVWCEGHGIWRGRYDPFQASGRLLDHAGPQPDRMNLPLVQQAMRADRATIAFMRWSILPVAAVTSTVCGTMVHFTDARYPAAMGGDRMGRTVFLPLAGRGC